MRTVKIVFTKSKKKLPIGAWLIRLWTWKSYSHVALEVPIGFLKRPMYFQANEGKVNYEYGDHFDKEHQIVKRYRIKVSDPVYNFMKKERMMSAGENYGHLQNLGIVLTDIAKLFGIKLKNPWKKGRNCSEIIYSKILLPMFPDLSYDPETIKPHHIERILKSKGYEEC